MEESNACRELKFIPKDFLHLVDHAFALVYADRLRLHKVLIRRQSEYVVCEHILSCLSLIFIIVRIRSASSGDDVKI